MPVRLKAFPTLGYRKRPIYVLQQKNEAIYVRLDEARVEEWLKINGLKDELTRPEDQALGSVLIENYREFGRFLETYSERRELGEAFAVGASEGRRLAGGQQGQNLGLGVGLGPRREK
ncbi:MAG TPA: hypothetical protein QGG32_10220 [Rhodospirillales bacterium]|nr:hypothetical protein [Rhodospirillales bacterium]